MHLAHQQLFKKLDKNGAIVVIQTQYANLSPNTNRSEHTKFPLFFYPLEDIKHLNGQQFIKLLNDEFPKLKKIIVGYDFHFGHNAAYSNDYLDKSFIGKVIVVKEYSIYDISIHSRVIREQLKSGNLELANSLLGYEYKIKGIHIKGQGIGNKEFVPTINIDIKEFLVPQDGVYATQTVVNQTKYFSVSFIGHRVTTDGTFAVETHLLVDDIVFSSAETLAYFCKSTKFATVVGEKTNGDGVGTDPLLLTLPKSGIVIRFTGEMGLNPDGSANDESKTVPDLIIKASSKKERVIKLLNYIRNKT